MKEIKLTEYRGGNLVEMIARDWMLVTAGTIDNYNTMTASWGFVGEMWFMDMAVAMVRQERYTKGFIDRTRRFTLTFFDPKDKAAREAMQVMGTKSGRDFDKMHYAGLVAEELPTGQVTFCGARLVLECDVVFDDCFDEARFRAENPDLWERAYGRMGGGMHQRYWGRIVRCWVPDGVETD